MAARRLEPCPLLLVLAAWLAAGLLAGRVVINELCYDPGDYDLGWEWIELFNAGTTDVNLEGARIQKAGSAFADVFVIPAFTLRAGRFLVIGEANVAAAVLHAELEFQNGGAETDGVRYLSPDGLYTDTVLYDSPNTNALPDDGGAPGTSFAPDVQANRSLARIKDGWDTDICGEDWLEEADSTPGLPNHVYVDYALLHPRAWKQGGDWNLELWVKNLSALSTPHSADLTVRLDGFTLFTDPVAGLEAGDSLRISQPLNVSDNLNHSLEFSLELADDPNEGNNYIQMDLFPESLLPPLLNEVMYDPGSGRQEWLELWVRNASRGEYRIADASGNDFSFSLPGYGGYYVLCQNSMQLFQVYSDCPASAVIEVDGWATLNNDGDTVLLYDAGGDCLDSLSYVGQTSQQGRSLERYLDQSDQPAWRYCLQAAGATPGLPNSQSVAPPQIDGILKLTGSPCSPRNGENIQIIYNLGAETSAVSCKVYDRAGNQVRVLAESAAIPAQGALAWDGRGNAGKILPRGLYVILWESRAGSGGKTLRRQFSAVLTD